MSDLSEYTHDYSTGERDLDDEINDMIDGTNCPDGWHQECDSDYPDNCSCEPD
ncbi:hypothetical protein [Thiorhodovibrio frisius]|uniref:hypothetical protein n=1 Tax=Thiorhodovibrio frisius TaxID=631362 RepID=UPI00022C6D36|nr:hypothetical protein [Thiorhodovibrio frisius]WPL23110.1 hypothetical protein Thiofri_03293 [Thiorhodovibrio frisius]